MNVTVWITPRQLRTLTEMASWEDDEAPSIEITIGDERDGDEIPDDAIYVKQGDSRAFVHEDGKVTVLDD